jgi:hypothetical protein
MSVNSQEIEYHCLILRNDAQLSVHLILRSNAQHRVSKDGPESFARFAPPGALPRQARDRPFEAPSGRLRARGSGPLRTRGGL